MSASMSAPIIRTADYLIPIITWESLKILIVPKTIQVYEFKKYQCQFLQDYKRSAARPIKSTYNRLQSQPSFTQHSQNQKCVDFILNFYIGIRAVVRVRAIATYADEYFCGYTGMQLNTSTLFQQFDHLWLHHRRHWLAQSMRKNICVHVRVSACKHEHDCTQKVDKLESTFQCDDSVSALHRLFCQPTVMSFVC